ncbi:MAG: glycosyl transferase [Candidatus Magasanikbacteria bacterium]|nr:glycosyl transferase [Candidatus Magasanikbacteria bacterium]
MFDLMSALEGAGHEVIHFSMHHPKNAPTPWSEYFVSEIDFRKPGGTLRKAGRILYSLEAANNLEALLKIVKPDVAHLHNIYQHLSPSILTVLKNHKIPVVQTLHDYKLMCPNYKMFTQGSICERCIGRRFRNAAIHQCINDAFLPSLGAAVELNFHKALQFYERGVDLFISPSKFMMEKFLEWGEPPEKIVQLPYLVNVDEYAPHPEHENYLLYFGRLAVEKGLLTLLNAMQGLPTVQLKIVGVGPQMNELKKYVDDQVLAKVEFLGFLEGDELKETVANARAVVLPSEWYENYPLAILEAMLMEKIVIASRVGGVPEQITDKETGFLFTPKDVKGLRETIRAVWDLPPDEASQVGGRARAWAEIHHEPRQHLRALLGLYNRVISG